MTHYESYSTQELKAMLAESFDRDTRPVEELLQIAELLAAREPNRGHTAEEAWALFEKHYMPGRCRICLRIGKCAQKMRRFWRRFLSLLY